MLLNSGLNGWLSSENIKNNKLSHDDRIYEYVIHSAYI